MFRLFLPRVCLQTLSVCNGSIQPGFPHNFNFNLICYRAKWLTCYYLSALTLTSVGHVTVGNLTQVYGSFPAALLSSNKTKLLLTGPVRWCWDQTNKYNRPFLFFSGCLWKHEICSWLKIKSDSIYYKPHTFKTELWWALIVKNYICFLLTFFFFYILVIVIRLGGD